jgi:hypothetical protein
METSTLARLSHTPPAAPPHTLHLAGKVTGFYNLGWEQ